MEILNGKQVKEEWRTLREERIRKGRMENLNGGKDKEEWRTRMKMWIKKGKMENFNGGRIIKGGMEILN